MKRCICIAGKNDIAVRAMQYLIKNVKSSEYYFTACINKSDTGSATWQPSYALFCKENNIPILDIKDCYELDDLLFISLEYDRLINPLKFKSKKLFNVHFSYLPAYKGMFTSTFPLINGEKKSGVTLHRIDKGIDTGDIIDQISIELPLHFNSADLYKRYLEESYTLFINNIDSLIAGKEISVQQPDIGSSYYSRGSIDFSNIVIDFKKTAYEVHNQVRAFCFREYQLPLIEGKQIFKSEIIRKITEGKPGTVAYQDEWVIILNTVDYQVELYIDKMDLLLDAASKGDVKLYETIAASGFPVKTKNKAGWDALIVACYNNQAGFVKKLLDEGWDVNSCNYNNTTAAMYAMTASGKINDLSILQTIASYSPDWKSVDKNGKNIFQYANDYTNPAVIAFLNQYLS